MNALLYLLGVVAFAVLLLASIGLHEFGHLIPAKRFGAAVPQWFIGFGNTVWSRRVRGTEYGLKALPLGGFVRIHGMYPGDTSTADLVATGQVPADARPFYTLSWWRKVVVMAGGPTTNLAIAFVIFLGIFAGYGVHEWKPADGAPVVDTVSQCVIPYAESGRECAAGDPVSPAAEAGLRPGDVITGFNGVEVTGWDQLRGLIQDNAAGDAVIDYERDGVALTGTTSTTVEARPASETDTTLRQVGFLGVSPVVHEVVTREGPLYTLRQMGDMIGQSVVALVQLPVKVWHVALAVVGVEDRAADSPVSIVGGGRIAGETAATDRLDLTEKLVSLLGIVAGFNLFIGVFNFVPLLPLDGGHIAGALWEAIRRRLARLLRRPDPGHVDVSKLLPVAYAVGAAMVVMGGVLILADLVVPVSTPY